MLLVEIQGHVFKIYAYILPHMDVTYDLILGQKSLYELEGGPKFWHINLYLYGKVIRIV